MAGRLKDLLWRVWYPFLTRLSVRSRVTFLNYGYADDEGAGKGPLLREEDEGDRPCIQLYHRVAGVIDLKGLDVLEVSCGHGGGAGYVFDYLRPKSMHGVDRNAGAIKLCKKWHRANGLTFSCGNALGLDFAEGTFDVVVNVEASHCYPDVARFFEEVRRVLRPGGHFLYADFRDSCGPRDVLRGQLEGSGLEMIDCEDISAQVVRGMRMNTEKYLDLIRRLVPRFLQKTARGFAGVRGSGIYNALESGETVYLCYHLRKAGGV